MCYNPTGRMPAASGPQPGRVAGPRPLPDLYWRLLLMTAKLDRTNGPNLTIWYFYKRNEGVSDGSGDQTGRTNETRDRNLN